MGRMNWSTAGGYNIRIVVALIQYFQTLADRKSDRCSHNSSIICSPIVARIFGIVQTYKHSRLTSQSFLCTMAPSQQQSERINMDEGDELLLDAMMSQGSEGSNAQSTQPLAKPTR